MRYSHKGLNEKATGSPLNISGKSAKYINHANYTSSLWKLISLHQSQTLAKAVISIVDSFIGNSQICRYSVARIYR